MKSTMRWAVPLLGVVLTASAAPAQYVAPVTHRPLGYAPDACGPGFYVMCPDGTIIGPNYCLRPPFEPFQGVRPMVIPIRTQNGWQFQTQAAQQPATTDAFPYHPFVRGPRDFFMFRENMEELARQTRPALVP